MKAYITLLSSGNYFKGVIVLSRTLKKVQSKYKLYCLVSSCINEELKAKLEHEGIVCINLDKPFINTQNLPSMKAYPHWINTFDKLSMWGLTQFEKVIFVDSDMMVLRNIDHLFECDDFSAVSAGSKYRNWWNTLNSGLLVITPSKDIEHKMHEIALDIIPKAINQGRSIGDQDVIQKYCTNWCDEKELHLDEGYNIFADFLTYYVNHLGYGWFNKNKKPIYIVHFIGKTKPWMQKSIRERIWLFKMFILKPYYFLAYLKYKTYL